MLSFRKGNRRFCKIGLIFLIQGFEWFVAWKISLTNEPSKFNICSKYLKHENKILPLRGIRHSSALQASLDVKLQRTPKSSLINLRCNFSKGSESLKLGTNPPNFTTVSENGYNQCIK